MINSPIHRKWFETDVYKAVIIPIIMLVFEVESTGKRKSVIFSKNEMLSDFPRIEQVVINKNYLSLVCQTTAFKSIVAN